MPILAGYIHIYMYEDIYMCVYLYIYISLYIDKYIYIYRNVYSTAGVNFLSTRSYVKL